MSVFKHQGKWMWQYQKNGARFGKSGYLTEKAAEEAQKNHQEGLVEIDMDFVRLYESRLDDIEARRTNKYYKENQKMFKKLEIFWGKKDKITRSDVEKYLLERSKSSKASANKELRFIKGFFNHCIERGMLFENPASKIKFFDVNQELKYIPPKEDVNAVLAVVNAEQRRYLLTVINTLARINEINSLEWTDVGEEYLILRTRKSKNSNRVARAIPFNDTLKEIFKTRKEKGRVFTYRGKPIGYRSKFLKNACVKAGVKVFTYHNLRHYGASMLASAGIGITTIQKVLGHAKPTTTDLYLQSIGNDVQKAMKILG